METVTISPKYQIVIPKALRDRMDIRPGQKLQAILRGDSLSLVPQRSLAEVQSLFAGQNNDFKREKIDRAID